MLDSKHTGQDIQYIVNQGRETTINSRCISEVRGSKGKDIPIATDEEIEQYIKQQKSYDAKTGLNPLLEKDMRLIKSREAMLSAIQAFNNPMLTFKTEQFCILSQIAWTGLVQEWLSRNEEDVQLITKNNKTLSLSRSLKHMSSVLSQAVIENIQDVKKIRDIVEHDLSQFTERCMGCIFNANVLNFNNFLTKEFGEHMSLLDNLNFALQFSKMDKNNLIELEKHKLPKSIKTVYDDIINNDNYKNGNQEYAFTVFFGQVASSKANANMVYKLAEGEETEKAISVCFDTDGKFFKKYPLKHKEDLIPKLKKYPNFKQDKFFIKTIKKLEKDEKLCGERNLDPDKKTTRKFYSPKMVDALVKELGLKK
ncbi:MAG: hypothetical protein P8N25_02795 [Alphaproteobacteria bacterium]|nr:hypothetical protein [Alphaproteobacteria bacterium]